MASLQLKYKLLHLRSILMWSLTIYFRHTKRLINGTCMRLSTKLENTLIKLKIMTKELEKSASVKWVICVRQQRYERTCKMEYRCLPYHTVVRKKMQERGNRGSDLWGPTVVAHLMANDWPKQWCVECMARQIIGRGNTTYCTVHTYYYLYYAGLHVRTGMFYLKYTGGK